MGDDMLKYDLDDELEYELYEDDEFLASSNDLNYILAEHQKYKLTGDPAAYYTLLEVSRKDVTDLLK